VQGVCKSTVAKGEDDFPDGVLRITDCHDSVIYALAPLQYASITCCSDCTVVVGAVGRMLRVERCERLQLIAGCVRICISSCHDCVFYLGVNRPPLMLGDNRFVQVTHLACFDTAGVHDCATWHADCFLCSCAKHNACVALPRTHPSRGAVQSIICINVQQGHFGATLDGPC